MRDFKHIVLKAEEMGTKALKACVPTPAHWVQSDLCNNHASKPWTDPEGECGGAYITGLEGKSEFVRWAKLNNPQLIRKGTYKGYDISLTQFTTKSYYGQSAEKYKAFAQAFCQVLRDEGVKCCVKTYLT
jgi:hypothetical protein